MSKVPSPTNQMGAEDWSGAMGDRWLANLARFEGMIAPIGEALMARAALGESERVIDVGCGAGSTSIDIARRVGASGSVLGLDISQALVDAANARALKADVPNLQFHCADAATFQLEGPRFDRLFSRFGLMFFPQPVEAFRNLHGLLRRGARADFSVWAPAKENAWIAEITRIVTQHIELPAPVAHAPGPFAFDDLGYLRSVLREAGFESMQFDTWQGEQLVGGAGATPEEAADFVLRVMAFGDLLDEANPAARKTVHAQLVGLFALGRNPSGVSMPAKAFLVTALA